MEAVCFLCQDYKSFVGHDTSNCPKSECKNCGQKGHFRMNCKFKTLDTPWYKSNKDKEADSEKSKLDKQKLSGEYYEFDKRPYEYELTTEDERSTLLRNFLDLVPPKTKKDKRKQKYFECQAKLLYISYFKSKIETVFDQTFGR